MKFHFPLRSQNPRELIRRAGYGEWYDREFDTLSYTKKLGVDNYPRFHIYVTEMSDRFEIDLHLDQKQASYLKGHAHSGEYDGSQVEEEARRITAVIAEIYGIVI
ncbi:MAG: hypothetical protein WCT18_01120 [Patescibacteria group bacterium]